MSETLKVGVALGFLISLSALFGLIAGQISVWRWLHKRYGVSWQECFYEWLDRELELARRYQKGWANFTSALDEVGRGIDD